MMATEAATPSRFRYRAFISYSHQDKAWADWLHKALETYVVPKRLVGQVTAAGVIPRRLAPIFRDRDELASATDLGQRVNAALAQSANLIVICSPRSAASRWVDEEILAFKRLGRSERIFCLIVDGEPNASALPGREAEECFAHALRYQLDANGALGDERTEPIAADARAGKDGKTNAKLKLIAGMLDVGFDALKRRELQRRNRRMTALAALALIVMAVTTTLAITAVIARNAAVVASQNAIRRQKQAEGLVNFMLGDLSDKLNQVHRLDIMQSVDDKAMAYFASLPAADASDAALTLRVKALQKIGSNREEAQGQLTATLQAFQAAATLAGELVRRAPGDIDRQAVWGDSLKWLGQAYWDEGDLSAALKNFQAASTLLQRAHAAKPDDSGIAFELAVARNNVGHVVEARGDFARAQTEYEAVLKLYQELAAREPANPTWQNYLGDGWDNLGHLALERGQLDRAIAAYRADQRIKAALVVRDPADHNALEALVLSDAILGRTLGLCGETEAALRYTHEALKHVQALLAFDASNTAWQEYFALYSQQAGKLLRQTGQFDPAATADGDAVRVLGQLVQKDPVSSDFQQELSQAQLEGARLHLARTSVPAAASAVELALSRLQKLRAKSPDDRSLILLEAQAHLLLGQINAQTTDAAGAQRERMQARKLLQPALRSGDDPNFLAAYAEALLRLGQGEAAKTIVARLATMGYRTPDFVALLAGKQMAYPVNGDFARRVAAIMQSEPAHKETASAR